MRAERKTFGAEKKWELSRPTAVWGRESLALHGVPGTGARQPELRQPPSARVPLGARAEALQMKPDPKRTSFRPAEPGGQCIEIMILWGASVLHTKHLTPPRSFYVGNATAGDRRRVRSFFPLHAPGLGTERAPIVLAGEDGAVTLVIPKGAEGWVELPSATRRTVQEVVDGGTTEVCEELPGARKMAFPFGSKACIEAYGVSFCVALSDSGRAATAHFYTNKPGLPFILGSTVLQLGVLAALALVLMNVPGSANVTLSEDPITHLRVLLDRPGQDPPDVAGVTGRAPFAVHLSTPL